MTDRRLRLRLERLTELSSDDLAVLGGAVRPPTPVLITFNCPATLNVTTCVAL